MISCHVIKVDRPTSIWYIEEEQSVKNDNSEEEITYSYSPRFVMIYNFLIRVSRHGERFVNNNIVSIIRRLAWPAAFTMMAYSVGFAFN